MNRELGQVISDGIRVRLGNKTGTVRRVMSDRRSIVDWDDKTTTAVYSGRLTVVSKGSPRSDRCGTRYPPRHQTCN